ncbi:hypothetical protein ABZZ47_41645, partial [Streptomyces sp. NPDC006465]
DGEGELADTVVARDAVVAVVAATVGFEVLGAQDTEWLSYRTLTRFWRLLLPRLAAPAALGHLQAAGTPAHPPAPAHQDPAPGNTPGPPPARPGP